MGPCGDVVLVRDDDDRVAFGVEAFEEIHDLHAGVRIERAGRLVCEQDRRMIHKRTSNRDALALTAREFVGFVRHAIGKIDGLRALALPSHVAEMH